MGKCPATPLTLEYLRGRGFIADIVERHVPSKPFPKKHDLFNIFDIVALGDGVHPGVYFIQTTSASNRSSRRAKMIANAEVMYKLQSIRDVFIELHTWKKTKGKYEVKVERASIEYPGGGLADIVSMSEVYTPSMAEVRARARLHEKQKISPSAKRERAESRRGTASKATNV